MDEEGIAIIDQHVAHERVLFERITERLTERTAGESAAPRADAAWSCRRRAVRRCISHAADLERLGFEIEEFGGDTVRVSAFPALLRREECRNRASRAGRRSRDGWDRRRRCDEAIKKIAATMACHAAVKANDPLTPEKMAHILDELRRTVVLDDLSRTAGR